MTAADAHEAAYGGEIEPDQPVDPSVIPVWRWAAAIALVPLVIALLGVVIGATGPSSPVATPAWIVWVLLACAVVGYVWKYPPARYQHLRYRIDDTGITIRDGVFWRTWSALPRARIQHTDVSQGPLQRRYGVAELKLYTAGSRFTRIDLPGLGHATALALRDQLQRHADDDDV